jgi:hypothetical protein
MIEFFKQLTPDEFYKFDKFIYSPYYTSQKNLIRLYEYLSKLYPKIEDEDLTKEKLSLKIYSEKKVNELKIRKLLSDFTKLMEKFFIQLEVDKNTESNKILLLEYLRKKGLRKRFEFNYRQLTESKKKKFSKDEEYYLNQYKMENEFYYNNFTFFRTGNIPYLQNKSDNLDFHFIFSKLHTFNEMLHMEGSKNKNAFYKKTFLTEIMDFVRKNIKKIEDKHPNIFIIYQVFMMFDTLEDKYLENLLKYLKIHEKKFSKDKLNYYYHYVTQYYIQKFNTGQLEYRERVFKIYKMMREKNLFLIDNIITDQEFNNVCNMGLTIKEFKWLDSFIEEYKDFIDPIFAKDAYNLAKAKLAFHQKDYNNVFSFLNEIGVNDPNYYTNSKYLLARVYFDSGNIESAKNIILNLKQYLRMKSTLTLEQSEGIRIFNKYLNGLIKIYECNISKEKKLLKIILEKSLDDEKKFVPNKSWFYEKISEIKS